MCGISGIVNLNTPQKISASLHEMTKTMANRGPDDEGYVLFTNDNFYSFFGDDSIVKSPEHITSSYAYNFSVGFGFRHLKIVDDSFNNKQPMSNETKTYWIVFNGEVYNYKEIREELKKLGHTFFSDTDTEVVLKSYIQWKSKALEKFNGMFSFTIYDSIENTIFCVRDRMGIKPFFYSKTNEQFIFGSTIKTILASKIVSPEISRKGLIDNFKYGTTQNPNTCFNAIFSLKPAHYLTINLNTNEFSEVRYWQIPANTQNQNLRFSDAYENLKEALSKAIKYRVETNTNIGLFLSGGIDSSLTAAIASQYRKELNAFTLGFSNFNDMNEVSQASLIAKQYNLNHFIQDSNVDDYLKSIHLTTTAYEEPYHTISANYQLSKLANRNNTRVVLNGLGGDELFGGYDCYRKLKLWKTIRHFAPIASKVPETHIKLKKIKQFSSYKNSSAFYSHFYTIFSDQEIRELFQTETKIPDSLIQYTEKHHFSDDFEALSFLNLSSYISNHQTRALDRTTMENSMEGRLPFLDHNFIETAFSIPTKYKYKNGIQKFILKQIGNEFLPKEVLEMPKKGLSIPLKQWIKNELSDFTNDTLNQLKRRHFFSNETINSIVNSNNETKIWQLVSTEIWLQNFIDN